MSRKFRTAFLGFWGFTAVGVIASCSPTRAPAHSQPTPEAKVPLSCSLVGPALLAPISRKSSPVALAHRGDQTLAFIADEDTQQLIVTDIDAKDRSSDLQFALEGPPSSLLVMPSGAVAVAIPSRSRVQIVQHDASGLTTRCSIAAPSEPVSMAVTEDGHRFVAVSAWGHALTVFDSPTLTQQARVDLPRDPRAVAIDDMNGRALVTHGVGGVLSVVDLDTHALRKTSLDAPLLPDRDERKKQIRDSFASLLASTEGKEQVEYRQMMREQLAALDRPDRFGTQGFSLALSAAPSGRVFVPQVEVDPGVPDQRSGGYGSGGAAAATPAVAVIDQNTLEPHGLSVQPPASWVSASIVAGREACRLPRDAATDAQSGLLLVACMGVDTLIGYDAASPSPIDAEVLRVSVAGGPTGVAVDSPRQRAVVWSQFERTLNIVKLPQSGEPLLAEAPKPTRIALAVDSERGLEPKIAQGRRLFHAVDDARIAFDGRSCANCHIGGRDDGLTWSTPNGPRRTKMLAATLERSAPYSWDGAATDLHDQLQGTFERLQGQGGLRGTDLDALLAYLKSLPPPPRDEPDAARVSRGRALFNADSTACSSCHAGPMGTDNARHDVASNVRVDITARFDTPTLRFLEGRAPYFHDGRYESLGELLRGSDGLMGHTAHLSPAQLEDLSAYLETL